METEDTNHNDLSNNEWQSASELAKKLPVAYSLIKETIGSYLDTSEENKHIITLWCLAASAKNGFVAFPILYVNASKGSGKTRLLKLIEQIVPKTKLAAGLSESVMFRLPSQGQLNCLCIDEAERLSSKEKVNIKDLLNQCYKIGGKVLRVEGIKKFVVKEYSVYMAVALANIWGLESVLEDRCIRIILERSQNKDIIGVPELFQLDERFVKIRAYLDVGVYDVYVEPLYKEIEEEVFGQYIKSERQHDPRTYFISYTTCTPTYNIKQLIEKIRALELDGRSLEMWMPLFIVSSLVSEECFLNTLEIAKMKVIEKNEQEAEGDRDTSFAIALSDYIAEKGSTLTTKVLLQWVEGQEGKKDWLNSEWIGRFLKRTNLIASKKRLARGFEFNIDVKKLKQYLEIRNVKEANTQKELVETEKTYGFCESCGKTGDRLKQNDRFLCKNCISNADSTNKTP